MANNEYKFFDKDTGLLKAEGVNKLVSGLKEVVGADKLVSIKTNRPELLEDKPQYKAYAGLRAMKTFDGKPLFTKGDTDAFVASFVKEDAPLSSVGTEAIASDMINSQSDVFNPINKAQASSLYELFKNSYAQYKANGAHGMAGLTNQEYMGYGLSPEEVDDPVMQSRVLAQEYQRAEDVLGGEIKQSVLLVEDSLWIRKAT